MNKKLLSAAVLLGLSSAATASITLSTDGSGSVLLYPYYTVNNGKTTNIKIVNTTDQYKAVKVRFNEGVNTWEVLDFNLYLSPWDVWSAAVTVDSNGTPGIVTSDTSCTAPDISGFVPFTDFLINKYSEEHGEVVADTLTPALRLTEGHAEVIEMGVLGLPAGASAEESKTLAELKKGIKHSKGKPGDCDVVRAQFTDPEGYWNADSGRTNVHKFIEAPTGGLFGTADIVDVAGGRAATYDATAINGLFTGSAHAIPGTSFPNLAGQSNSADGKAVNQDNASKKAIVFDSGEAKTAYFVEPIDALSAVLMAKSVSNIYYKHEGLNAVTDWVVTFPTKHAYVNDDTSDQTGNNNIAAGQFGKARQALANNPRGDKKGTQGVAPFRNGDSDTGFKVPVQFTYYDDEEGTKTSAKLNFSPTRTADDSSIYYEVNVLQFSKTKSVFASNLSNVLPVDDNFKTGWAKLSFKEDRQIVSDKVDAATGTTVPAYVFHGLPVLGFAVMEVQNTDAQNVNGVPTLANYAGLYEHRYDRQVDLAK